jgi:hypothetical protein
LSVRDPVSQSRLQISCIDLFVKWFGCVCDSVFRRVNPIRVAPKTTAHGFI